MGDLIRKSKIYNYIKAQINPFGKPFEGDVYEFGIKLMEYIEQMDAEESVTDTNVGNKWIPIGQYPAEPSLLCFENGEMVVGHYDYDDCEWLVQCSSEYYSGLDISDDEPIAWMELPKSYEEE